MTTDDRVRGGSSHSNLTVDSPDHARFHGHLDTSTLGGAGFASQHSLGELHLDLTDYDGIIVSIRGPDKADGKRYALTLKDALAPPTDDGREQSSVSWEAQFVANKPGDIKLPWDEFKATYRGREKDDAGHLDLKHIKRIGLMMRRCADYRSRFSTSHAGSEIGCVFHDGANRVLVFSESKTVTSSCTYSLLLLTNTSLSVSSITRRRKRTRRTSKQDMSWPRGAQPRRHGSGGSSVDRFDSAGHAYADSVEQFFLQPRLKAAPRYRSRSYIPMTDCIVFTMKPN